MRSLFTLTAAALVLAPGTIAVVQAQEGRVGVVLADTRVGAELGQQRHRGIGGYRKLTAHKHTPSATKPANRAEKAPPGRNATPALQELRARENLKISAG